MATLDWSQCPAAESNPGKRSGAWVFKGTPHIRCLPYLPSSDGQRTVIDN
jgi:hypothetical protein